MQANASSCLRYQLSLPELGLLCEAWSIDTCVRRDRVGRAMERLCRGVDVA